MLYCTNNISIEIPEFCIAFYRRSSLNSKVLDTLESNLVLLSPHENSLEFGNLLQEIFDFCEIHSGNPEPLRESYEIGDTEFRDSIEKTYLRLQTFLEQLEL